MSSDRFSLQYKTLLGATLVLAGALAFRIGLLSAPGEFDEFYHLLAARGWAETGSPRILDGEYWRGALFTRVVAGLFMLANNEELATARLASVAAGALVPVVLFFWVNRVIGIGTAALSIVFMILWPQGIIESQLARFYTLHVLAFVTGTAAFYLFVTERGPFRALFGLSAAMFWAVALHLQISAIIGIAAVFGAATLVLMMRHRTNLRSFALIASILISGILITLLLAGGRDAIERAWAFYRWTPAHAEPLRDYAGFYFDQLRKTYGVLWLATPVLALLGLRINAQLTVFCTAFFVACFVIHSFGGMKALRYLSYALPFLFVVWTMGLVAAFEFISKALQPHLRRASGVLAGLALVAATGFTSRSVELAIGNGLPSRGDWRNGSAVVGDWINAPFIATTRELHHIAHIGPYDALFSKSRVTELSPPEDFGIDPRTGRPVVGSPHSIAQVLQCVPDGLLVTSGHWWRTKGWEAKLTPMLEASGSKVSIREDGALLAIRWQHTPTSADECGRVAAMLSN